MPTSESNVERSPLAIDLCAGIHLEKPARKLLREEDTAIRFINVLADSEYFGDAARVLAHLLPSRESVWWACLCARQTPPIEPLPEWDAAVAAAERWVTEMTEESRIAAGEAAKEAEICTAAGCAANAAFATSGSISPPTAPPVQSPPGLAAQYVAASVTISALSPDPTQAPGKYRTFLNQGVELYVTTISQLSEGTQA